MVSTALALAVAVLQNPPSDDAARAEFLRSAEILGAEPVGKGVTETWRVELVLDGYSHAASFQSVDERAAMKRVGNRHEIDFVDSYRYNIAAYRLAGLLGLAHMVPVSVERTFKGRTGAMTWWVDDVAMDEAGMKDRGAVPPDEKAWGEQIHRVRVFSELVHDTDRNQGNLLITSDWRIWMIDFTRAFRRWPKLQNEGMLFRCDRKLYERLSGLGRGELDQALGAVLSGAEIDGLWARRELLLAHFDRLAEERGEAAVFY